MRRAIFAVVFGLLSTWATANEQSQAAESTDPLQQCDEVERPLIRPVITTLRDQSADRLASEPIVDLTDAEAARLLGAHFTNTTTLAATLSQEFLRGMQRRKYRAEVEHRDSWSVADEDELTSLASRVAARSPNTYKAFLVKAVARTHDEPTLVGELCGTELHISATLMGEPAPSKTLPAVVFLPHRPNSVVATMQFAR